MRNKSLIDQVNETPTTYAVLLIYVTMAFLTDPFSPTNAQLFEYGASAGILVQDGEMWRLLSCAFLHGGIIHLLLNSYGLMILGPILERSMGVWRFILLYAITALTGSLLATTINVEYVSLVGGSGALFGMLGAASAYNVRGGRTLVDFLDNYGARQLITLIVLNLLVGLFVPEVSNSAHIGGLISGFVLVFCFLDPGRRTRVSLTGRVTQAGWIAVFLSMLVYAKAPVLRFDYNLKTYLREQDPVRREQLRSRLENDEDYTVYHTGQLASALEREQEPKTGLIGVAIRERYFYADALKKTVRRWKRNQ